MGFKHKVVLASLIVLAGLGLFTATANAANQWDVPDYTALSVKATTAPVETETSFREALADGFDDMDANSDGFVSYAEALAVLPGLTQSVFDAVDTNGDGKISRKEARGGGGCFGCAPAEGSILDHLADLFLAGLALIMMTLFGFIGQRGDDNSYPPLI